MTDIHFSYAIFFCHKCGTAIFIHKLIVFHAVYKEFPKMWFITKILHVCWSWSDSLKKPFAYFLCFRANLSASTSIPLGSSLEPTSKRVCLFPRIPHLIFAFIKSLFESWFYCSDATDLFIPYQICWRKPV